MKLMLGKPDESEMMLAEQSGRRLEAKSDPGRRHDQVPTRRRSRAVRDVG